MALELTASRRAGFASWPVEVSINAVLFGAATQLYVRCIYSWLARMQRLCYVQSMRDLGLNKMETEKE